MRFMVSINSSDAALLASPGAEVSEILSRVAELASVTLDEITAPELAGGVIRDGNGNTVGRWEYVPEGSE